ncbi:MAG: hypothetical protein ACXWWC_15025 [Chitinophagaceae bacterium]
MKKIFTYSAVLFSALSLLLSCSKNAKDNLSPRTQAMPDRVINAKVAPGQTYTLSIANSGDVSIHKQAAHFLISETAIDEKNGSIIYRYIPASGFKGIDEVLLSHSAEYAVSSSSSSSNGCNNGSNNFSKQTSSIAIKFTVVD